VQAVILPKDRAAGITPVVHKVACGAVQALPIFTVTNLARTLRQLREAGVWLYGASDSAPRTLFDTDLRGPLALVLGGEGSGLRRLTRELCDFEVAIPMAGTVSSLNVSVAAGVLLFEAVRQRKAGK
jgi:23S rRNA (guanosine2251-2'-O)-methyltransferase